MTATWPSTSSADSNTQDQQLSVPFMSITYHLGTRLWGAIRRQNTVVKPFSIMKTLPHLTASVLLRLLAHHANLSRLGNTSSVFDTSLLPLTPTNLYPILEHRCNFTGPKLSLHCNNDFIQQNYILPTSQNLVDYQCIRPYIKSPVSLQENKAASLTKRSTWIQWLINTLL